MRGYLFAFCAAVLLAQVAAHGRLSSPSPRGFFAGKANYQEEAPVSSVNGQDFICRNDPAPDQSNWIATTAGGTVDTMWTFPAAHVGDCFFYITYDSEKTDSEKKWFKIAEIYDCKSIRDQNYALTIPNYLPSSSHAILRFEWYALHVRPTIEFYCQCVDITISGKSDGVLPGPQVNIPGHLPSNGSMYRDGFTVGAPVFFTGPPVATADYVDPEGDDDPKIACDDDSDCPSGLCEVSGYCFKASGGGLGAGGTAALVIFGLLAVVGLVAGLFLYLNKSEIPYLKPFKGRM